MDRWIQRLRGTLGNALTWAIGWCGAGLLVGTTGLLGQLALGDYAVFGASFAVLGFASGAAFSVVLSLTEGRRRFDQMSLPRFGVWGALGGALISLGMFALSGGQTVGLVTTVGFFMLLGASSSAGSLLLARWAERDDLLASAEELDEVGLSSQEAQDLLGQ